MNEQIKELWAKAAEIETDDSWEGQTKFIENFAKLIVRECLYYMENCDGDLDFALWKTKEHFGVEE